MRKIVGAFTALTWLSLASCSGEDGDSVGAVEEGGRLTGFSAAHNVERAQENADIPNIVWDEDLAGIAQSYANKIAKKCELVHSGNGYGENLSANWGWESTPEEVVQGWASERADYNYSDNSCNPGRVCGHYTQVVWADSTKLGCGLGKCDDGGEIWVCNYDKPGNFNGQKPY